MKVLLFLGQKPLKSEVALIIWVSSFIISNTAGSWRWPWRVRVPWRIPHNVQEMYFRRDWTWASQALQPCSVPDVRQDLQRTCNRWRDTSDPLCALWAWTPWRRDPRYLWVRPIPNFVERMKRTQMVQRRRSAMESTWIRSTGVLWKSRRRSCSPRWKASLRNKNKMNSDYITLALQALGFWGFGVLGFRV